jgi:hypothetical protein
MIEARTNTMGACAFARFLAPLVAGVPAAGPIRAQG